MLARYRIWKNVCKYKLCITTIWSFKIGQVFYLTNANRSFLQRTVYFQVFYTTDPLFEISFGQLSKPVARENAEI